MASKVKDDNYRIIHGWMINHLGLKGVKLNVYAIIYGFSQDGENEYTGTLQYLCDCCGGVSKPTMIKALKELVDAELILRREEYVGNNLSVRYRTNLNLVKISAWADEATNNKVKDEAYYVIHGWMVNHLKLKGIALDVYANIYGFSHNKHNKYTGTVKYLCNLCGGVSKPTMIKALKELVEKQLILRYEEYVDNVVFIHYATNLKLVPIHVQQRTNTQTPCEEAIERGKETLPVVKKLNRGSKETCMGPVKELHGGSKETLPNKEIHKKEYIKDILHSVVGRLNEKTGKNFRVTNSDTQAVVSKRVAEGYTLEDFIRVIDKKCEEWMGTRWEQYLCPALLFGFRFEQYLFAPAYAKNVKSTNTRATTRRPAIQSYSQSYDIEEFERMLLADDLTA